MKNNLFGVLIFGFCILFVICCLSFVISAPAAAVPQYLNYQGVLRDANGTLVAGTKTMRFYIYNALTGGTAIYDSGNTSVTVAGGYYTAQLGPLTNAATAYFDGNAKYLEIAVEGSTLSPRLQINSVAYAIRADNATTADTVADASVTAAKLASNIAIATSGNITTTGTTSTETLKTNKFQTAGTGTGYCAGTGTIASGGNSVTVTNTVATANSLIFLSPATQSTSTYESLAVISRGAGTFDVGIARTTTVAPTNINFYYLIVN